MTTPQWLEWAQRLQAIAQSGLTYNQDNPFEVERFEAVSKIAAEMMAANSSLDKTLLEPLFAGQKGYATPKIDVRGVRVQGRQNPPCQGAFRRRLDPAGRLRRYR